MFGMEGTTGRGRALVAAAVLVASSSAVAVSAAPAAATPAQDSPALTAVDPIEGEGVDPVLDGVEVERTADTRRADGRYGEAQQAEGAATTRYVDADRARLDLITQGVQASGAVADAERTLAEAEVEVGRQEDELDRRDAVTATARRVLTEQQGGLRSVVSAVFTARPTDALPAIGTFDQLTADQRRQDVRERAADVQVRIVEEKDRAWRTARGASQAQQRRLDRTEDARDTRRAELEAAIEIRDELAEKREAAEREVAARSADLDAARTTRLDALRSRRDARLMARVTGTDLTLVGLHAYWRASSIAPCTTPWWLLAGIGKVESGHGTAQGNEVQADGRTSDRILGIALDGRPGVAAIGDTDGGLLDGDGTWDRAVGPMQFIPGTWARWGRDGNGDGVVDPHNLYDAAEAAATYLCFGRAALTDDATRRAALLSYNRSVPYGTKVLAVGRGYLDELGLPELAPAPVDEPLPGG